MSDRSWLEMPISGDKSAGDPVRPRYAVDGNVLLVYRGEKVYAAPDDPDVVYRIAQLPNVRRLAPSEAAIFEATLPGGHGFERQGYTRHHAGTPAGRTSRLGLGDAVSWLTSVLGMRECRACGQRKKRLNKLTVWR